MSAVKFNKEQLDILSEVGNMTVGQAATSLSDFVNKMVTITIPTTKVYTYKELREEFASSVVTTKIDYTEGFEGSNLLMMQLGDAVDFSKVVTEEKLGNGDTISTWGDLSKVILEEVFNIMVGNMSSGMSDIFNRYIKIGTPVMYVDTEERDTFFPDSETLVAIWFDIRIETDISIRLCNIITISQAQKMLSIIEGDYHL
ncbi:hypothetical protein CN918_27700 [Priestia megaterium]|nr:hypothetical protein CN918_27700 [Priestia megaterium]